MERRVPTLSRMMTDTMATSSWVESTGWACKQQQQQQQQQHKAPERAQTRRALGSGGRLDGQEMRRMLFSSITHLGHEHNVSVHGL